MTTLVETAVRTPLVALIGNPNTGKSTVFNRLTGLRQHIANYPGITTEARSGSMVLDGQAMEVLDLPGTYSLCANSPEEAVVVDVLCGHGAIRRPDLLVCIIDASNLKRNLFLASQLADFAIPMILVLNQWDVAQRNGTAVDPVVLARQTGVPVITTVATKNDGLDLVRREISKALASPQHMVRIRWRDTIDQAAAIVIDGLRLRGDDVTAPEALRMVFDNSTAVSKLAGIGDDRARPLLEQARAHIRATGLNPSVAEALLQYEHIDRLLAPALPRRTAAKAAPATGGIDRFLIHRVWGSVIFVAIMWTVFQAVYAWAGPLMDGIDALTGKLQAAVGPLLAGTPVFQSLIVDGIIAGVGGVLIFLPQIFVLFLFIAILEDSGYMARAAFLMDRLFGWCGLNGKSFVPLLSSYACAIPGVMAARSLEDPRARWTTILMAPFMSCSARLPVYVLMIGSFIEPVYGKLTAGWVLFAMHFVGLAVSLPIAWLANRVIMHSRRLPFILEMPACKVPNARNVLLRMWEGGREFLLRAGTVILAFSIIIWALLYFPRDPAVVASARTSFIAHVAAAGTRSAGDVMAALDSGDAALNAQLGNWTEGSYIEHSYLGRFGKTVQPIFAPAGFDWKISIGVLASFPAREVVIATLGIIYNLGPEVDESSTSLRATMAADRWTEGARMGQPVFTVPVALALMVYFALCLQCGATVAVLGKQLGWRWAAASFSVMTALAWTAAVVVYQTGTYLLS